MDGVGGGDGGDDENDGGDVLDLLYCSQADWCGCWQKVPVQAFVNNMPNFDCNPCKARRFLAHKSEPSPEPNRLLSSLLFVYNFIFQTYLLFCKRHHHVEECLKLQGLPTALHDAAAEIGMTNGALMAACGNAWPVNVVTKLVGEINEAMSWQWCWDDGEKSLSCCHWVLQVVFIILPVGTLFICPSLRPERCQLQQRWQWLWWLLLPLLGVVGQGLIPGFNSI